MTLPLFDLHTHSSLSDGCYRPIDLVTRARHAGVGVLALTDHDTVMGIAEAREAAEVAGISFIPGVEVSVTWERKTLHVLGLQIDAQQPELLDFLGQLAQIREDRAREMGHKLARSGVEDAYLAARELAEGGMVTRTHFARVLVSRGLALDVRDVFNRYLTSGKPGYVPTNWASLSDAVTKIRVAGGVAVLAHPLRYRLTKSWLRRLAGEFKEMGGLAVEVISGHPSPGELQSMADFASRHGLLGSCGSDFHGPDEAWPKLGRMVPMPEKVIPVWSIWNREVQG